jgi:hypothetical protein
MKGNRAEQKTPVSLDMLKLLGPSHLAIMNEVRERRDSLKREGPLYQHYPWSLFQTQVSHACCSLNKSFRVPISSSLCYLTSVSLQSCQKCHFMSQVLASPCYPPSSLLASMENRILPSHAPSASTWANGTWVPLSVFVPHVSPKCPAPSQTMNGTDTVPLTQDNHFWAFLGNQVDY